MERSSSSTDTEAQQSPAGKLCLLLHLFTAVARHQKHSLCCWEMKNFQRRTEISPAARSRWFESKRPLQERHRKNARPLSSGEDFLSADVQRAVTLSQDVLFSSLNLVPCNWAKASTLQLLLFSISVCSAYCITPSLVQCNGSISLPVSLTYLLPPKKRGKYLGQDFQIVIYLSLQSEMKTVFSFTEQRHRSSNARRVGESHQRALHREYNRLFLLVTRL